MTLHPLAGVSEKLRNADDHLHRLQDAALAYLNSGPNASIIGEHDPDDSTRGVFRFNVLTEPPLKLAAIAGDAVHNMRSALDYFVEEAVKANGARPTFNHGFPVAATADAFKSALGKGKLLGISKKAANLVEGFQPYQVKPEARDRHPLAMLHALSNRDKHHMLAISALNASLVWSFVADDGRVLRADRTTKPVRHGESLAEVPTEFVIDGQKAHLKFQITTLIAFDEPSFPQGFDVLGALQHIREFIGRFMFPAFIRCFDPLPEELQLRSHGITNLPIKVDLVGWDRARGAPLD